MWNPFKSKPPEEPQDPFVVPSVEDLAYTDVDMASRKELLDYVFQWCQENDFLKLVDGGRILQPNITDPDKPLQILIYETAFRNLLLKENLEHFIAKGLQDTKHDFSFSRIVELAVTIETIFDSGFINKFRWKFLIACLNYGPNLPREKLHEGLFRMLREIPTIWVMYIIQHAMQRVPVQK